MSGPWSVPSSLHTVGWTHDSRLHFASTSGREHRIVYMFAVAPPMSEMMPLNSGSAASFSTSFRTDAGDRLWMIRPWWAVIELHGADPSPRDDQGLGHDHARLNGRS